MNLETKFEPSNNGLTKITVTLNGAAIHSDYFDNRCHHKRENFLEVTVRLASHHGFELDSETIEQLRDELFNQSIGNVHNGSFKSQRMAFGAFTKKHKNLREVVIAGICRRGDVVNLIASPKAGKSWLAIDLAMAVSTGTPWLKFYQTLPGRVLYLDAELDPTDLSFRATSIAKFRGYSEKELKNFEAESFRGRLTDIFTLAMEYFVQFQEGDFDMIVLDALYRFMPTMTSENDNAAITQVYNTLAAIAAKLNVAIILVHHSSKGAQSGKSQVDVGSGASAAARAADTHITIREHDVDDFQVLEASVRSFPKFEPVSIHFTYPCWHVDKFEKPVLKRKQTASEAKRAAKDQQDIAEVLTHFGGRPFANADLRKAFGGGQARWQRLIREAMKQELIVEHKLEARPRATSKVQTYIASAKLGD